MSVGKNFIIMYFLYVCILYIVQAEKKNTLDFYEPRHSIKIANSYFTDTIVLNAQHTEYSMTGFTTFLSIKTRLESLDYSHLRVTKNNKSFELPLSQTYLTAIDLTNEFKNAFEERYDRYSSYSKSTPMVEYETLNFEYYSVSELVNAILILEDLLVTLPDVANKRLLDDSSEIYKHTRANLFDYNLFLHSMIEQLEIEIRILDRLSEGQMDVTIESFILDQIEENNGAVNKVGDFNCINVQLGPICTVEILHLIGIHTWYQIIALNMLDYKLDDHKLFSRRIDNFDLSLIECERISDGILFDCSYEDFNKDCEKALNDKNVPNVLDYCTFNYHPEFDKIISTIEWVIYQKANLLEIKNHTDLPQVPYDVIGIKSDGILTIHFDNKIFFQESNSDELLFAGYYFSDKDMEYIEDALASNEIDSDIVGYIVIGIGSGLILMSLVICGFILKRGNKRPKIIFRVNRNASQNNSTNYTRQRLGGRTF